VCGDPDGSRPDIRTQSPPRGLLHHHRCCAAATQRGSAEPPLLNHLIEANLVLLAKRAVIIVPRPLSTCCTHPLRNGDGNTKAASPHNRSKLRDAQFAYIKPSRYSEAALLPATPKRAVIRGAVAHPLHIAGSR
jgi:hypothetical protein